MLKSVISPKTPTSPKVYQQDDASTPNGSSSNADMEEDDHHHNNLIKKFSVLAKVKERAKKWRHSLSKKRLHSPHDHETNPTTPSWGVALDDHQEDDHHHHHDPHNVEDDSEFFGTPMHEFEHPPEDHKESSDSRQSHLGSSSSSKELETYETAKMNSLRIGVPESPIWEEEQQEWLTPGGANNWDKGVSVKEYLIEKLKPGEDDKALSQVISDAISLRKKDTADNLHPKEEQLAGHSNTDSMTNFPVSTNPHEDMEEENRGRVLQTNKLIE